MRYGAVGSVLNLASRLCDAAIVVSQRVLAEVEEFVDCLRAGLSLRARDARGSLRPAAISAAP
jgi:class 3 adenylate cyclase